MVAHVVLLDKELIVTTEISKVQEILIDCNIIAEEVLIPIETIVIRRAVIVLTTSILANLVMQDSVEINDQKEVRRINRP